MPLSLHRKRLLTKRNLIMNDVSWKLLQLYLRDILAINRLVVLALPDVCYICNDPLRSNHWLFINPVKILFFLDVVSFFLAQYRHSKDYKDDSEQDTDADNRDHHIPLLHFIA